jgi:hypothetical protein
MEIMIPSVLVEQRLNKILINKTTRGRRVYTEPTTKKRNPHTVGRACHDGSHKKSKNLTILCTTQDSEKESEGSPITGSVSSTASETDETRL